MTGPDLPAPVAALADQLAGLRGAVAVVLGGSRATGQHREDSDWDFGVYYRGQRQPFDPEGVRLLGHEGYVSELNEWGPIMNGGAWLTVEGLPVDVLFRDLDLIGGWLDDAREGRFEILTQNGYVVGAPTYLPVGELAIAKSISGELSRPDFPSKLSDTAATRWEGRAGVALMFAANHARSGDPVCCAGMLSNAVLCVAHARLAGRREWVLNEKLLVERAGLSETKGLLANPGLTGKQLVATVDTVSTTLGVAPLAAR